MMMPNLNSQGAPHDFWVWADLREPRVREGLQGSGEFRSAAQVEEKVAALPFVENPGFLGQLSPFGLNVVRDYAVEYRLELQRLRRFLTHPSRLSAIFLFGEEDDAWRYARTYPERTLHRHLLRVTTCGGARWSWHDSGWIEVLRATPPGSERLDDMACAYWRGDEAPQGLHFCPAPACIFEVLFLGRIAVQHDHGPYVGH